MRILEKKTLLQKELDGQREGITYFYLSTSTTSGANQIGPHLKVFVPARIDNKHVPLPLDEVRKITHHFDYHYGKIKRSIKRREIYPIRENSVPCFIIIMELDLKEEGN